MFILRWYYRRKLKQLEWELALYLPELEKEDDNRNWARQEENRGRDMGWCYYSIAQSYWNYYNLCHNLKLKIEKIKAKLAEPGRSEHENQMR